MQETISSFEAIRQQVCYGEWMASIFLTQIIIARLVQPADLSPSLIPTHLKIPIFSLVPSRHNMETQLQAFLTFACVPATVRNSSTSRRQDLMGLNSALKD